MTTYYIDPTATFNGDGTTYTHATSAGGVGAKNTWGIGAGPWAAGNFLLQRAGTTWDGELTIFASGTSESARITLGSYDPATGAQTTKKAIRTSNGTTRPIVGSAKVYITVQDTEFVGGRSGNNLRAFTAFGADYLKLKRCTFRDVPSDGSTDCDGVFITGNNVEITDCLIYNIADDGIWLDGLNARITNNVIREIAKSGRVNGDCIQLYGGDARLSCGNFYIANNFCSHLNTPVKQGIIVSACSNGSGGIIADNIVEFNTTNVNGTSCIYTDQPNTKILRNKTTGGVYGITTATGSGVQIKSNLVSNSYVGININSGTGIKVEGNTVVSCAATGIYNAQDDSTATIKNNLIYKNATYGIQSHASVVKDYNSYYGNGTAWATGGGGGTIEGTAITSDPLLTQTFIPKTGSPVIAAGVFLEYSRDVSRVQRDNPPSIGAFESSFSRGTR